MWIPWLKANTWILWKPQESSREMVNIPEEPVSIRKPGYWRKGVTRLSGVSSGGSTAASGRCCKAQWSNPRSNPCVPLRSSPKLLLLGPFARTFKFQISLFFTNLFFKFSVNLNDNFLIVYNPSSYSSSEIGLSKHDLGEKEVYQEVSPKQGAISLWIPTLCVKPSLRLQVPSKRGPPGSFLPHRRRGS